MSSGRERGERGGLEARGLQVMAVVHVAMRLSDLSAVQEARAGLSE